MPSLLYFLLQTNYHLKYNPLTQLMTITTRMDFYSLSVLKWRRYHISCPVSRGTQCFRDCPLGAGAHPKAADLCSQEMVWEMSWNILGEAHSSRFCSVRNDAPYWTMLLMGSCSFRPLLTFIPSFHGIWDFRVFAKRQFFNEGISL